MVGRDVRFLRFRYYEPSSGGSADEDAELILASVEDGYAPDWAGRGLPRAVEIVVSDEMPPEGEELPRRYARRVVYLPGGDAPLNAMLRGRPDRRPEP